METQDLKINDKRRVEWIDCAKGIAILIVVMGHTVSLEESVLRGAIYSFHMPLFFILSCVTFRCSVDMQQFVQKTKKAFQHLIIPAVLIFFLRTLVQIWQIYTGTMVIEQWSTYFFGRLLTLLFSSGVAVYIGELRIDAIGMPWFLVVLFLGRTLFDFLHMKMKWNQFTAACVLLSIAGVIIAKVQWLPFSFDIALAIMPFFFIGHYFDKANVENKALLKGAIWFLIWAGTLLVTFFIAGEYMELACRRYTLYPICYITATAGTIAVAEVSVLLAKMGKWMRPVIYLGKYSLYFLCVHMMDYLWIQVWAAGNSILASVLRIVSDIIVFSVLMFVVRFVTKKKSGLSDPIS